MSYKRGKKLVQFWCTVFGMGAIVALFSVAASAQAPSTIFQLNGNPANDGLPCTYGTTTTTCDYWNLINGTGSAVPVSGTGVGHSALNTFLPGSSNTFSFTTGGSKDPSPISSWAYATTGTPNKDTLNAAYAAAYNTSGLDIIFGADRLSPSGNANIGIWFFQDNITTNGAGGFTGAHRNGDVFVISSFTTGGGTSTISVFEWNSACTAGVKNPKVGQCADTNLLLLANPSTVCGASDTYCAITNGSSVSATWASYSGNQLASPLFFEGGVDITAAFAAIGGDRPCFASFMEETRSSASTSSVLKDFLLGRFPVCSMNITKSCGTTSYAAGSGLFSFPVNGVVTNTGIGTLYNVQVKDCVGGTVGSTGTCSGTLDTINVASSLAAGASANWIDSSTSTTSTLSSQSDQAYAIAAESSGGSPTLLQSTNIAPAACSAPVHPAVTVTKSCSTAVSTGAGLTFCDAGTAGTVTYTVSVSNSSNAGDIVIDQICDTAYGNIFTVAGFTGPACAPGSAGAKTGTTCTALDIAPGQIATCTFTAVQGENATVINTVSVSGHSAINPSSTFPPTGSNSVTVTSTDAPSTAMVTKGIDSTTAGCATVRYTVDVHNSSGADEVLTLSAFNDSAFGSITTVQGSVLGTTCGVASGAGTLSGATGGGALPATLAVGGSGSDYTCKFDAQFCGALTTITTTLGTCNGITCSAGRTGSTCTQNSDCDVTCNGLQHINKVTATLNGDEGTTDPVTQTGNTLTVKECFASSVSSATP